MWFSLNRKINKNNLLKLLSLRITFDSFSVLDISTYFLNLVLMQLFLFISIHMSNFLNIFIPNFYFSNPFKRLLKRVHNSFFIRQSI